MSVLYPGILAVVVAACAQQKPPPVPSPVMGTDSTMLVLDPVRRNPTRLHAALARMVADCVGATEPVIAEWVSATSIVGDPSGTMFYGILYRPAQPPFVPSLIFDRAYWYNVLVVTHELVHLIGGVRDGSPVLSACSMSGGVDLPERTVSPEELSALRDRAVVLRGR